MKVSIKGSALFDTPILNKGSAFPENERRELGRWDCCHSIPHL
jgi:hypothetical protein